MKMRIFVIISILTCFLALIKCQEANSVASTKVGTFTAEELDKLKQLREMIKDIVNNDYMKSNGYLIRWLQAKNMDVKSAYQSLDKAMKWRKDNNINKILDEEPIPELERRPFYSADTINKAGFPVLIAEVKKMDTRKFVLGGQSKQFVRHFTQMIERMENRLEGVSNSTSEYQETQGSLIVDLADYNLRQHGCIACVQAYFQFLPIFEQYYPGLFNDLACINTPRLFSPLFELVKPLMSSGTLKGLNLYKDKGEWQPKLLNLISPDQLPRKFGGTKS